MKSATKRTRSCQSTRASILRVAIRLDNSRTAAPESAITSRGHGERTKSAITAAVTASPFPVCHVRRDAASSAGTRSSSPSAPRRRSRGRPTSRPGRGAPAPRRRGGSAPNDMPERWPISMFWGLPIASRRSRRSARRRGEQDTASGRGPGARSPPREGRHGEADDVVRQQAESAPTIAISSASSAGGEARRRGDAPDHPRVEAAHAELRRDDHEAEEQRDRRHVDRVPSRLRRHLPHREQGDGAEERDAGPVEGERRDAARDHARVHRERRRRGLPRPFRYLYSRPRRPALFRAPPPRAVTPPSAARIGSGRSRSPSG